MAAEIKNYFACLNFGGAICTYIEEGEEHFDDEEKLTLWFQDKSISENDLFAWVAKHLTVIFDGELDKPDKFNSIKAIGLYGPNLFGIDEGPPLLSGFSVYLEVKSDGVLSEDDLEDIFHLMIPVIQFENTTVAFTEFDDHSVFLEEMGEGVRPISVVWPEP